MRQGHNNQDELREALGKVRTEISNAQARLERWREEEKTLLKMIVPHEERYQNCIGRGKVMDRDYHSGGYEYEVNCHACGGTGRWREPV